MDVFFDMPIFDITIQALAEKRIKGQKALSCSYPSIVQYVC